MCNELALYKLCSTEDNEYKDYLVSESGWTSETDFVVWVPHPYFIFFLKELKKVFGNSLFGRVGEGFSASIKEYDVCINLCNVLSDFDIDLQEIFPKEEYKLYEE